MAQDIADDDCTRKPGDCLEVGDDTREAVRH
jgi:hypothetical protein